MDAEQAKMVAAIVAVVATAALFCIIQSWRFAWPFKKKNDIFDKPLTPIEGDGPLMMGKCGCHFAVWNCKEGTIEEWKHNLKRYRSGNATLSQFVEKWRGKMPEKPVSDKGESDSPIDIRDKVLICFPKNINQVFEGAFQSLTPAALKFKDGDWVRGKSGSLYHVLSASIHGSASLLQDAGGIICVPMCGLEPAFPRKGEWWDYIVIGKHRKPFQASLDWTANSCNPRDCYVVPINFGRGSP